MASLLGYTLMQDSVGGIVRGPQIEEIYTRIFQGPVRVWVEFYDVVDNLENLTGYQNATRS